jgi:hypothetical protein
MKHTIIIIATIALFACQIITAHCQTIKSSTNMNTITINEYWSYSTQMPLGGYAVNFTQFTFYENGTFEHRFGYSGGVLLESYSDGNYYYDADKKTIKLEIDDPKDFGFGPGSAFQTPSEISIMEITDHTVTIDHGNGKIITMRRKTGITSDQYWDLGNNGMRDYFHFSTDGSGERYLDVESKSKYIEIAYLYEYSIVDNILFLEIIRKRVDRVDGKRFTHPKKTFIRLDIGDETVKVEKIDFEKIEYGTRDWLYQNGKHIIINDKELKKEIVWEEYNRVK